MADNMKRAYDMTGDFKERMFHNGFTVEDILLAMLMVIRDHGYAAAMFTRDELREIDNEVYVEDAMIAAGNDYIATMRRVR